MKQRKKWKLNSGVKCYGTAMAQCVLTHRKQWGQVFELEVDGSGVCWQTAYECRQGIFRI